MKDNELFQFYEKLYFHEIESREKLNARLQTPLTLIASFIAVLAFFLQNYIFQGFSTVVYLFIILIFISAVALGFSIYYFVKSWFNNTYNFLPSAKDSEEYRQTLLHFYETYPDGDELAAKYFANYLMRLYIDCSTANTACNDNRSLYLHKTNSALIVTAVVAFFAFLVFFFGDLDKNKIKKVTEVSVVNPITVTGGNMVTQSDNNQLPKTTILPPPPPSPPPPRQIREGVGIVKPPSPNPSSGNKK